MIRQIFLLQFLFTFEIQYYIRLFQRFMFMVYDLGMRDYHSFTVCFLFLVLSFTLHFICYDYNCEIDFFKDIH